MALTSGSADVTIGLLDGPVAVDHPELSSEHIYVQETPENVLSRCSQTRSKACQHGTFVAGILSARRGSSAPAICPDCSLLVRPIFTQTPPNDQTVPSATPPEVA